jgi:general secretion pathway protein E
MNAQAPHADVLRFWRLFNEEVAAGNNLGKMLRKAAEQFAGSHLGAALAGVLADVMEREQTVSQAMAKHPEVFDPHLVAAVKAGEYGGIVDRVLPVIVEALEAGDLNRIEAAGIVPSREACEYVSTVLEKAFTERASDIHFEPLPGGAARVRIRVDGVLQVIDPPPTGLLAKVIVYLKMMGAMNPAQHHLPQDGVCDMAINRQNVRLFIGVVPAHEGEQVTVRMSPREAVGEMLLGVDRLGLSPDDLAKVRRLERLPSGMIIVSGPTGSGKTTILYSMLKNMDSPEVKIVTVEDPVEVSFAGMAQIQTNPQAGLTHARAIRAVLRSDPDIIMVGEIRDLEVANLCVQCVLTGHLVLTTLHADTTVGAVRRLVDMGLERYLAATTVAGVITPKLVRRLCPACRKPAPSAPHVLPPQARQWLQAYPDATFYEPGGCDQCRGHGYKGRAAIYEILIMSDRLRQMVTDGASVGDIRAAAIEEGTKPMLIDGLEKAAAGIATIQAVLAALPLGADR